MKIFKRIIGVLLLLFLLAQFFRPTLNNGKTNAVLPFVAETKPSKEVVKVLETACFDCHSNATNYPWYSNITPVNFWMEDHIKEGKKELNFSDWSRYSIKKKEHKMEEVWEEVEQLKMPLDSYTWTHFDAKLSQVQIDKLVDWAKKMQKNYQNQLIN